MPANYDAAVPAPLLIVLHGYGSFGAETADYLGLDPFAEANGFLTAYPEGTPDPGGLTALECDPADDTAASGVDDAAYLSGLVAEVADTANVDPDRVFAMGHSNGAFMAYRMACDHADVFAAAVSLAGATLESADECQAADPIAVLEIHGDRDDVVLYGGGTLGTGNAYPSVADTASLWRDANGCEPDMLEAAEPLDLDRVLPGPETVVQASTGCDRGRACRGVDHRRRGSHPRPVAVVPRGGDRLPPRPPAAMSPKVEVARSVHSGIGTHREGR